MQTFRYILSDAHPSETFSAFMSDSPIFDLIAARTGLEIRAKDRDSVTRALAARQNARGLASAGEYLKLLAQESAADGAEWRALAPVLTNGESYFWRDRGQFALLKTTILPRLLREHGGVLRVWSAGCSSGEEVYSLAMLIEELSETAHWPANARVSIVGTDINEEALARARRGIYGDWSFRGVEAEMRERHFVRVTEGWQVRPALRSRVSFRMLNLSAPDAQMRDFDLILCRNVLIYLTPAAVQNAVQTFAGALRGGGFLMTGHAELTGLRQSDLTPRIFPESVIYQKDAPAVAASRPSANKMSSVRISPQIKQRSVVKRADSPPKLETLETESELLARAQKLADVGAHERAAELCRAAIASNATCADAYLLWAHIEIERGQSAHAKTLLKKVLYLAPDQAQGYLELAALYDAENDAARAATMRAAATKIGI